MKEKNTKTEPMTIQKAGLLQGKAYRILNIHMDVTLEPFNVTIPEWKLLGQLYDDGSMKLADLAHRLGVEPPLITALVDQLEKKKMVLRKSEKKDKRVKLISLTPQAAKEMPKIELAIRLCMRTLVDGITPLEMMTYLKVLARIIENG